MTNESKSAGSAPFFGYFFPSCCEDGASNEDETVAAGVTNEPAATNPVQKINVDNITTTDISNRAGYVIEILEGKNLINVGAAMDFTSEACETAFPALFSVARKVPWIGPVAGALYVVYQSCEVINESKGKFKALKEEIDKSLRWMNASEELFIDPDEEFALLLQLPKHKITDTVTEATTLFRTMRSRMEDQQGSTGYLKSWVMAQSDTEKLDTITASLKEATEAFIATFPQYRALKQSKADKRAELKVICECDHDSNIADKASLLVNTTRDWLFKEVSDWIDTADQSKRIFWLQATAGMGKTVFTAALAERLRHEKRLLAVHMFQFQNKARSKALFVCQTLARQLAEHLPTLRRKILDAAKQLKGDTSGEDPLTAMKKLIAEPLKDCSPPSNMVIVLDGLDEVGEEGSDDRKKILDMLIDFQCKLPNWVKIFVSGRPESDIKFKLSNYAKVIEETDDRHKEDLKKCLVHTLQQHRGAVDGSLVDILMQKSEDKFIYLAMVADALTCLSTNISNADMINEVIAQLPQGIYGCYEQCFLKLTIVFKKSNSSINEDVLKQFCELMVAALKPLSIPLVGKLLKLDGKRNAKKLEALKEGMKMMFPVRRDDNLQDCFYPFHKSIIEWLTNNDVNKNNYYDKRECHEKMTILLLHIVKEDVDGDIPRLCTTLTGKNHQWYEWFGLSKCPAVSSLMMNTINSSCDVDDEITAQLHRYTVTFLCDHLDLAEYERECYQLLTSLAFIQAVLELHGVVWLRDQYEKRGRNEEWLQEKNQSVIQSLMRCCNLLLGANDPKDNYFSGCWSVEICTQIVARLDPAKDIAINTLISDAKKYIQTYGGILIQPGHFAGPDGPCDAIINLQSMCYATAVMTNRPDTIVIAKGNEVALYNTNTFQCEKVLSGHSKLINSLCVLADGRVISGSRDTTLRVWNVEIGICEKVLAGHTGDVLALVALPDGRVVSGSDDKSLRVWNVDRGESVNILKGHTMHVTCLCVLSDGRVVSGSWDTTLRVWMVDNQDSIGKPLVGHEDLVTCLCALSKGRVASGFMDKSIRIWQVEDGICEQVFTGHVQAISALSILPDGRLVSGSWDRTLRAWTLERDGKNNSKGCKILADTSYSVCSLRVLPDGRIINGCSDNTLRVWKANSEVVDETVLLEVHSDEVKSMCILSDGRVASGSKDSTIRIWTAEGVCEKVLRGHSSSVNALCQVPDGRLISGSSDKSIRIWNVHSGECVNMLSDAGYIASLCVLPDGRVLSGTADDGRIRVWNIDTFTCEQELEGHSHQVTAFCVLPDGRIVSGSADATLCVWNILAKQCCERKLMGHTLRVTSVCAMSEDRVVSISQDLTLRVWNVNSGKCEKELLEMHQLWQFWFDKDRKIKSKVLLVSGCFSDDWSYVAFVSKSSTTDDSCTRHCIGCSNGRVLFVNVYSGR